MEPLTLYQHLAVALHDIRAWPHTGRRPPGGREVAPGTALL